MVVVRASIHILLIEELVDLLYEMNDACKLYREVDGIACADHLHDRLVKALFYIAVTAEQASLRTDNPREILDFITDTISTDETDGYVDRGDLTYILDKALTHIQRMRMAYAPELEEPFLTLLNIIELCLTDTNYLIYE